MGVFYFSGGYLGLENGGKGSVSRRPREKEINQKGGRRLVGYGGRRRLKLGSGSGNPKIKTSGVAAAGVKDRVLRIRFPVFLFF